MRNNKFGIPHFTFYAQKFLPCKIPLVKIKLKRLTSSRNKSLIAELESSFCGNGVTVPTSIKPKPLFRKPFIASASRKKEIEAMNS